MYRGVVLCTLRVRILGFGSLGSILKPRKIAADEGIRDSKPKGTNHTGYEL